MNIKNFVKIFIQKNKTLLRNFSSLTALQISQYIFPIVTFPYLVRVLGPDGYGLVSFANAFIGYFTVLTDYGFNLSATKDISLNRNNQKKIEEIFYSVLGVKLLLLLISILILIPVVLFFSKFNDNAMIYIVSFFAVFGTAIFPIWFFQGIEEMGYISWISIIVKILWVVSIFLFVKSKDDIIILVWLNSLSSIITGVIGLWVSKIRFKLKLFIPSIEQIKFQLEDSWHYFLSNVSVSLYTISNIFILGLFTNDTIVGYFSAADKIRYAVQNMTSTAGRTIFPHLSTEFSKSRKAGFSFVRKYVKSMGSFILLLSILLFIFSEQIVLLVLGPEYLKSVTILKILSFLPFIIFVSNVAGIQTMVNLGYKKEFAKIIIIAGVLNIILSFIIVPYYLEIGSSIAVLVTELVVTFNMLVFLRKKNIHIFKKASVEL
ncbi:MAG: flippase [Ignavibacteriales bacterium]|nr:flippase [Ignavibacteriales bacterium]